MPSFPIVVEDTSPMLSFSTAAWRAGVSGDSQLDQYSASSYLLTQTDGATISFGFFGSSVQVFGAKRSYHGQYQVQVDDFAPTTLNGTSNAELFNQLLFSTNFSLGNHLLQFTNLNVTFTDLDYISYQTSVGRDDEELIVNTFEDGHPYFTYSPANAWGNPAMVSTFIGSTGHATTTAQASANFTFQGDAVALYGPTGPNSCSSYSIKIDNGNSSSFTANRQFYKPQTMLYYAGNLGPGRHTLQIQIPGANSGEFAIDFATVYTTPSLGGSNIVESNSSFGFPTSSPGPVHVTGASRTQLEKNLIAGLAIVSTALVLVILTSIYMVWRQRRGTSAKSSEISAQKSSGVSPFRSSQRIETPITTADIDQPVVSSLGNRRGKLAVDIIPVSRVPEAVASSSSTSAGAQQSELQSNVDTSVSPPHYTLSADESLVNSGSTSA